VTIPVQQLAYNERYKRPERTVDQLQRVRALIEAAQAGDEAAWRELYEQYHAQVLRYVRWRVPGPDAEDLAADVWVRTLKGLRDRYTFTGQDLGAWLVTIARNLIADHYKCARSRLSASYDPKLLVECYDHGEWGTVLERVEAQPERQTIGYLDGLSLWGAVRRLVPLQRRCIELRFAQGLSVSETAQEMGCNDAAIKSLQHRAIQALQRQLESADLR